MKNSPLGRLNRATRVSSTEGLQLAGGLRALLRDWPKNPHPLTLLEHPLDSVLLRKSSLYRRSRALYLKSGGKFRSVMVSSPRTLSSSILLDSCIEYSPTERELLWSATDRIQSRSYAHLLEIRSYSASLFHEQNHRILWKTLPPAPRDRHGLRRYLNLAESLVITADMALGDELGPSSSRVFYLAGVAYDPGTPARQKLRSQRVYRNYLQMALYSTYLLLELYDPGQVRRAVRALFPAEPLSRLNHAVERSGRLDLSFILKTNLFWQRKHGRLALKTLSRQDSSRLSPLEVPLELPKDPLDHRLIYLWGEKWFDVLKI